MGEVVQMELSDYMPMKLDSSYYVVQANELINGKQSLGEKEAKLVRIAITQILKDDMEFKPYRITAQEFADMLGISSSNLQRREIRNGVKADKPLIEEITDNIFSNPLYIRAEAKRKGDVRWLKMSWVSYIEYDNGTIYIKLNDDLKPLLIGLKKYYTQYTLDNILRMKSERSIRLFEMIQEDIKDKFLPKEGLYVDIMTQTFREACNLTKSYKTTSALNQRVINPAIEEIERCTNYTLTHKPIKDGRKTVGMRFHVNMSYH